MARGPKVIALTLAATAALTLSACASGGGAAAPTGGGSEPSASVDTDALGPQAAELQELYDAALEEGEDKVVVYAGLYSRMKPMFDAFTARFPGIRVEGKDTYGAPMETTIGQEVASQPAERGDLAHTADTTMLNLADNGLLEAYKPPAAEGVEGDQLVYQDNLLTATDYSFFGNLVNTDVVDTVPESWEALLEPELRDKIAIQDPTKAGSGNGILTTLANDPDYGIEYAQSLKDNGLSIQPSAAELQQKVVDGTYGVAIFASYTSFLELEKAGAPVEFVFPVEGGVWIPVQYFGLIKDAPHPNAARLLMNYFFTPEAQETLNTIGEVSVMEGAPTPEGIPPIAEIEQLTSTPLDTRLENQAEYTAQLVDIFS